MRKMCLIAALLVLMASGPETALAVANGTYKGRTSQRFMIKLIVRANRITYIQYRARYLCSDGRHAGLTTYFNGPRAGIPVRSNGSWSFRATLERGTDTVQYSGRISGNAVTGHIQETYISRGGHTCKTGKLAFSGRR